MVSTQQLVSEIDYLLDVLEDISECDDLDEAQDIALITLDEFSEDVSEDEAEG